MYAVQVWICYMVLVNLLKKYLKFYSFWEYSNSEQLPCTLKEATELYIFKVTEGCPRIKVQSFRPSSGSTGTAERTNLNPLISVGQVTQLTCYNMLTFCWSRNFILNMFTSLLKLSLMMEEVWTWLTARILKALLLSLVNSGASSSTKRIWWMSLFKCKCFQNDICISELTWSNVLVEAAVERVGTVAQPPKQRKPPDGTNKSQEDCLSTPTVSSL